MSLNKKQLINEGKINPELNLHICKGNKNGRYGKHWTEKQKQQISCTRHNQIWITKNDKDKFIFKEDLLEYVENGWKKGRSKGKSSLNKIWVNKDNKNFLINPIELEEYLSQGYKKGKLEFKGKRSIYNKVTDGLGK